MAPDNRSFIALKKFLKKPVDGLKTIRVAIVADSASQFIHQALKGYGIAEGIHYDIFEADYNQIDLQVFDPGSELYESKPDYVIILRSTEKLLKKFYSLSGEERAAFGTHQAAYAKNLYQQINSQLKTRVLFNTFPELNDSVFGNFSTKTPSSFLYQLRKINMRPDGPRAGIQNLFLVDLAALVAQKGYAQLTDAKDVYQRRYGVQHRYPA